MYNVWFVTTPKNDLVTENYVVAGNLSYEEAVHRKTTMDLTQAASGVECKWRYEVCEQGKQPE